MNTIGGSEGGLVKDHTFYRGFSATFPNIELEIFHCVPIDKKGNCWKSSDIKFLTWLLPRSVRAIFLTSFTAVITAAATLNLINSDRSSSRYDALLYNTRSLGSVTWPWPWLLSNFNWLHLQVWGIWQGLGSPPPQPTLWQSYQVLRWRKASKVLSNNQNFSRKYASTNKSGI